MTCVIGDKAPDFNLPTDGDGRVSLSDFKGQALVLYFYPKDDTPGCTKEACAFSDGLEKFNSLKSAIVGVSKDSIAKHDKFKEKYNLTFPLASDEHDNVCENYGVWGEKSMYGKTYMGIERTTFLMDGEGVIRHIWRKVKVDGHFEEVLDTIRKLQN